MTRLWIALAVLCVAVVSASADTIRVPEDYPRITTAVNAAVEGDTVLVGPGTYNERFTIMFKNIVLRGEMGAESTIIDGSVGIGNVITVHGHTSDMIIEDFTIRGGKFNTVAPESTGTAIYVNQGSPIIQRCRLTQNNANGGGGVSAYFFSRPTIRDCWIAYNTGGGIWLETDNGLDGPPAAHLENTEIVRNAGFGLSCIKGAKVDIERCTIAYNAGDGIRAEQANAQISVHRSIITHNSGGGIRRRDSQVCFVLSCNDVFGNTLGEWVGTNPRDPCFPGRGSSSVSIDPLYNDPLGDDFTLAPASPLYQLCQGACGSLGANNTCDITAVERSSWSSVKDMYRE
jgi:hypothetical protein